MEIVRHNLVELVWFYARCHSRVYIVENGLEDK